MRGKLSVVYFSPGWPLSDYPNGIVTYIKNLQEGFGEQIDFKVLALHVRSRISDENVFVKEDDDLHRSLTDKLIEKLYYQFRLHDRLISKRFYGRARLALKAISENNESPDIIEVEESFGLAK